MSTDSIPKGLVCPQAAAAELPAALKSMLRPAVIDREDTLTVLTAVGSRRLTKRWTADGKIDGYDQARNFHVRELPVANIEDLSRLLTGLQDDTSSCLARGRWPGWGEAARRDSDVSVERKTTVRRSSVFTDQPLHALMIDADGFRPSVDPVAEPQAAIEEFIRTQLPPAFRGCSYHFQLSSSAGHPDNAGVLKAHIWFWLASPLTSAQVKAYMQANTEEGAVDLSLYSPVQVHYTANPLFDPGVDDPVKQRSGFVEGLCDDAVEIQPADVPRTGRVDDDSIDRLPDDVKAKANHAITLAQRKYTQAQIESMLTSIPNVNTSYGEGRDVFWAARDGLGQTAEGLAVMERTFASRYVKDGVPANDPEENAKLWWAPDRPSGTRVTVETLRRIAESHGWQDLSIVANFPVLPDLPETSVEELLAQLRAETPESIAATWVERAKGLSKADRILVIQEVHLRTQEPKLALRARLSDALAADARAQAKAKIEKRVGHRLTLYPRADRSADDAALVERAIVNRVPPGAYIKFGGGPAAVICERLPGTHQARSKDAEAPAVPQISPLSRALVLREAEAAVAFVHQTEVGQTPLPIPNDVRAHLCTAPSDAVPEVSGLLVHPLALPDGRILSGEGHDPETGLFLVGADVEGLRPYTQEDAAQALQRIKATLFGEFSFATPADADYAVAAMLTGVQRRLLPKAPGLAAMASKPSSGKTTLVQMIHLVLSGHDVAMSTYPTEEVEMRKMVLALLLRSPAMIAFDNIADGYTVRSESLALIATSPTLSQRMLGENRTATVATNVMLALTGNNLKLAGDEIGRWITVRLEPTTARPEERHFANADVVAFTRSCRSVVLRDCVGIIAGYLQSGAKLPEAPGTRFPEWDRLVRQPIVWAGGVDVTEVFRENGQQSEEEGSHVGLLVALERIFGDDQFTATDVSIAATGRWIWGISEMPSGLVARLAKFEEAEAAELQGLLKESLGARTNSDLRNSMTVGHVLSKLDRKRIEVNGGVWNLRMRMSAGRKHYRVEK